MGKIAQTLRKIDSKIEKGLDGARKGLAKAYKKKIKSRRVLKKNKMTVTITERNAEYVPQYFQGEMEDAKRALFFK